MKTLCIVPCGNRKIWDKFPSQGATEARHVYIGPLAKKCREYAEKFYPSSWCILSAKYGFLMPDDIVEGPYNVSFNKKATNPITKNELVVQAAQKGLDACEKVIVLGGKNYIRIVQEVFSENKVYVPLEGCNLFEMMGKLNDAIIRGTAL